MNPFNLVSYDDASPDVRSIYDETMKEMGTSFVLNWFKCQGGNAVLLRGNWEKVRATMLRGNVPFVLKQLIMYNISVQRGSDYCAHAHGVIANSLGSTLLGTESNLRITDNLDSETIPSAFRAAIRIITACALEPGETSAEHFETLSDEGFSLQEVQELMALADLTNMINTIAEIAGIGVDRELEGK